MGLFSSGAKTTFSGIVFVVIAVIFLLGGLGFLRDGDPILSFEWDIIIAFLTLALGLAYIYSEVGKPGKPKFEMEIKETTVEKK